MKKLLVCCAALLTIAFQIRAQDIGPVSRWVFDSAHILGKTLEDEAGGLNATITGDVRLNETGEAPSMLIDRDSTRVEVPYNADALPHQAMTLEAWASIEDTVEWGGLISCWNQEEKKGFLLGYKQSNFHFALATKEAKGFAEARDLSSLAWGQWYHVAGVYDGDSMRLYVNGQLEAESDAPQGDIDLPTKAPFVLAEWGGGEEFHWQGWMNEAAIYNRALSADEIKQHYEAKKNSFPRVIAMKTGPYINRIDAGHIEIHWQTEEAVPSTLLFGEQPPLTKEFRDDRPKTDHKIVIGDLEREKLYYYRILLPSDQRPTCSRLFEFDSTFDYTEPVVPILENPFPDDDLTPVYDRYVNSVLDHVNQKLGYCLVLGARDGRLAYEIAKRTQFRIVCVDDDDKRVAAARRNLDKAGLYGVRVSVHKCDFNNLPFTSYFANLIVSDRAFQTGEIPFSAKEMFRILRPSGGVAAIGQANTGNGTPLLTKEKLQAWLDEGGIQDEARSADSGVFVTYTRPKLPGAGDWSHMYADGGNSACSMDQHPTNPMRVIWFGEPGPRPMVDRGTRPPGPLSVNGRLFVEGDRRLFGIDAYNGTILWTLEIPDLRRANVPRDSGNMTATDDYLFAVVKDACWKLDAQTGKIINILRLPEEYAGGGFEWGYLGQADGIVYGSVVKAGGTYIGADGEWYDDNNQESDKVISEAMFAMNADNGAVKWIVKDKAIINSTICFGDGRMYWVESRAPKALQAEAGRMKSSDLTDRFVFTTDLSTGKPLWERSHDFTEGSWVFYMAYSKDTLVIISTTQRYQIYAFDAKTGDFLWDNEYPWYRDHHGGAMQRPVIVGDLVYAEPRIFHLRSGEMLDMMMPERNKCGTITASAHALFYRDSYHGMWDLDKNIRTHFIGVRPGCWLGVIPAGGLMLAPESSAGCYCAHPIQTSMAYVPVKDLSVN
ncbi:MAG: PQQ-binding-like beta-propeller repeat protein [bacterium]|nr:PQQ-binding-like beta-propeller repeat protein [bacterium]